ncbi:hypothetical protein EP56_07550 [Listeriaceae bacterium FSL A5-0209]|nr:hypothetical protein EP56_07550 [Listeriaceae bacterium FSL A5-0209]
MRLKKKAKLTPPIPKETLIHEIYYEELSEEQTPWGTREPATKNLISHVRVDLNTVFSRDSTQKKVVAEAIIFIDATNSVGVPDAFVEESKITFEGKEYTLKKVIPCFKVESNEIRHWELEVI